MSAIKLIETSNNKFFNYNNDNDLKLILFKKS